MKERYSPVSNWRHQAIKNKLHGIIIATVLAPLSAVAQPGSLDPDFDIDGKVTIDFDGEFGVDTQTEANATIVLEDGSILSLGNMSTPDRVFLAFSKQNPDGSLDTSFGADVGVEGLAGAGFGPGTTTQGNSLLLLPDENIIAGGKTTGGSGGAFIAKSAPDSSFDTSFGSLGGVQIETIVNPNFGIVDMALQADGKIVATLRSSGQNPSDQVFVAARFMSDGSLDATFGNQGVSVLDLDVTTPSVTRPEYSQGLVLQGDKILLAGETLNEPTMIRLNSDGSLDTTFGLNGIFTLDTSSPFDAVDLALQSDGKIVFTGSQSLGKDGQETLVLRTDANGVLDTTFGSGTGVFTQELFGSDTPSAMALQADDKILVAGYTPADDFTLARLTADGTLDSSFGNNGTIETDIESSSEDQAFAIAVQPDEKIVLAGRSGENFALARYLGGSSGADLSLTKEASADSIIAGTEFDYTFTVSNSGPGDASNILLSDTLPTEINYVSCSAPGGSCSFDGTDFTAQFSTLAASGSHLVTLTAELDATVTPGSEIQNSALVVAAEDDPDQNNNSASASFIAAAVPEPLRFYLHGYDVPGTAGGFTMDFNPPSPPTPLSLNLAAAPRWYSEPALDGSFVSGDFVLQFPCSLGIGLATTYALHRTALDGSSPDLIGSTTQPLQVCVGTQTVSIPVNSAEDFDNERLRLRISTLLGLSITLDLGENVWLDTTEFTEDNGPVPF